MEYRDPRAAEARRLRLEEGMSLAQIKQKLGVGNDKITEWLKDAPHPEWTKRSNAKDRLRDAARSLRASGKTYDEIAEVLQVSKSSVSLWVRDTASDKVPAPGWSDRARKLREEGQIRKRAEHAAQQEEHQARLYDQMGPFSSRDILMGGAIAYWCEGAKVKPWRRSARVDFTNTDPNLLRLFLRFLQVVPVIYGDVTYRLDIHETGDEARAKAFGAKNSEFVKTTSFPRCGRSTTPRQSEGMLATITTAASWSGSANPRSYTGTSRTWREPQ